jgi:hypothetical protein
MRRQRPTVATKTVGGGVEEGDRDVHNRRATDEANGGVGEQYITLALAKGREGRGGDAHLRHHGWSCHAVMEIRDRNQSG